MKLHYIHILMLAMASHALQIFSNPALYCDSVFAVENKGCLTLPLGDYSSMVDLKMTKEKKLLDLLNLPMVGTL